jgi:hypothetical protein
MTWIDSTIGPGLEALQTSLENVLNNHGLLPNQPPSQRTDRNEKTLLSAVWAEVQDRLNQSLHNAVLLNLGKADQRHQVSRPWDSQLRIADQASRPLDPETAIVEVFDRKDINGRLLILGNPGAGKTTTMLDLAAALVQRANTDPTQPIPVMFNLSSWKDDKQTLKDWLLSELKLKYGVSPKLGQTWLEAQTLLPLLDALDELPPHRQEPAVQKINDWLQSGEGASQLLVCSRREEYELYATKLLLNGAICLEPLTDSQLATYFAALGMEPLWHTVRQDPDFLALVRTPLLLSVSILANDNIDPAQWQRLTTPQERLDYLLDAYIQRQLHAPIASRTYPPHKQPTPQQTRHWLTWLAQQLQDESEDEFLITDLQPSGIKDSTVRWFYWYFLFSVNLLMIAILFITASLPSFLNSGYFTWKGAIIAGFLIGFPCSFVLSSEHKSNGAKILLHLFFSPLRWLSHGKLKDALSYEPDLGYIFLSFRLRRSSPSSQDIQLAWNEIWQMCKEISSIPICGIPIIALLINITHEILIELSKNLRLRKDYVTLRRSWREIKRNVSSNQNSNEKMSDYNTLTLIFIGLEYDKIFHRSSSLLALAYKIFERIRYSLLMIIFTSILMPTMLTAMMVTNEIDYNKRPNEGVIESLRLLLLLLLIFSSYIALIQYSKLPDLAIFQSIIPFFGGLIICIISLPLSKHFSLRFFLTFYFRAIPWNYARFLNHCTERLLLQRVGGRYRFIHRLIQERFATTGGHRLPPP